MGNISRIEVKRHEANSQNFVSKTRKPCCSKTRSTPVDRVLFLQRTIGNQAVRRLMKSEALQAKLRIGAPGDVYEQEADRVADAVMRMSDPQAVSSGTPSIQRTCPKCEEEELKRQPIKEEDEEEKLQRKPLEDEEEKLQAKTASGGISEVNPDLESNIQSLMGGGIPLSQNERAFFEPRFGQDFGNVRTHADQRAAESAKLINARAFTMGNNVVFGAGEYRPHTEEGRRLMAHELTHTVQQGNGSESAIQKKIEVNTGLDLDTMGFTTSKSGNVYTCPAVVKGSIWNELFTSLLFSPRVFKLAGTTNLEINSNLKKHMASRYGIVDFASKKQYSFGAGAAFKMNPKYWIVDSSGWRLKPGADREKAINDLNVHPKEYSIACLAATQLTMEGGSKSPMVNDFGAAEDDWIPGDWGYIENTNFPASGGTVGLEGENIIYTGKDKFWGHFGPGIEYKTLKQWYDQVKSWDGGADIKDHRTHPKIGLE